MAVIELQAVKQRLGDLGVSLTIQDDNLLLFSIEKVTNYIKNETNQPYVPNGAYEVAIDMVIADFFFIKYTTGTLDIDGIDFNLLVAKSIKDGDTNVDYGTGASSLSPTDRFLSWLNYMRHGNQDWGIWRKFRW